MALYWPEARVAVRCEGSRGADEQEWPTSVIVIDMRPDQADDPDFIEAVRGLVMDRTIERRRLMLDYIFEFGDEMPEPRGGEPRDGEEPNEADEAEARLRSHLMERDEHEGEGTGEDDCLGDGLGGYPRFPEGLTSLEGTCLGFDAGEAPRVLLAIRSCEQIVIDG